MIRLTLFWLIIFALSIYAWKDWYKSACGLIVLLAFIEHPDMPRSMFGIQGLNPWNVLLLSVLVAWASSRRRENLVWDVPRHVKVLLLLYMCVVVVAFLRMMSDRAALDQYTHLFEGGSYTTAELLNEYLINSVKWVIPGWLLFDGARTRQRQLLGLGCILLLYAALAAQVIRWMPPEAALSGEYLARRSHKLIRNEIGYSRVTMSMLLAGGAWAVFAAAASMKRRGHYILVLAVFLGVTYAQALTAGRMGYVAWAGIGLVLCLLRWRRYLAFGPLVVMLIMWIAPGTVDRMLQGFGEASSASGLVVVEQEEIDAYEVTAGRNVAWPYIVDKILESPIVGHGLLGMKRTGLAAELAEESFGHPHNAYLEMLLDNGLVGFMLAMPFYFVVLVHAVQLLLDRRDPLYVAAGGAACALVLALLVAGIGSHSFYPRANTVGMWAAIGLMFRLWVERRRASASAGPR